MRSWGLALSAVVGCAAPASSQTGPCSHDGNYVHIDLEAHRASLCEGRSTEASYAVSLGSEPGPKTREGDHRSPHGAYPLAAPRRSRQFRWFVPIGYPTPAQRAQGYTGSAVGLHGPPRWVARAGVAVPPSVLGMDWTDGCVAVGSDADIDAIVEWLQRREARRIELD
jgi:L,D-transpeptidase catalytic domain